MSARRSRSARGSTRWSSVRRTSRRRTPAARAGLAVAGSLMAGLVLAGCGSTPTPSAPTGVDELVVPTPDPTPSDFVETVDNPWFPLADGATWAYEAPDGSRVDLEVTGTSEVAGVRVTSVRRVARLDGDVVGERVASYAQDRDGNVWSFGREVVSGEGESWRAGVDGAQAGLLVPAEPRVGDGWLQQESPTLTTRVQALGVDRVLRVGGEEVRALLTRDTVVTPGGPGAVVRTYARGRGLVEVSDEASGETLLRLVDAAR